MRTQGDPGDYCEPGASADRLVSEIAAALYYGTSTHSTTVTSVSTPERTGSQ